MADALLIGRRRVVGMQQIHVIAPARFVQPLFESTTQWREVRYHERNAEREHPETEHGQKPDDPTRHQHHTEQRAHTGRDSALRPTNDSIRDDDEPVAPGTRFADASSQA